MSGRPSAAQAAAPPSSLVVGHDRSAGAEAALELTGNDVKLAILVRLTGLEVTAARATLALAGGFLRRAIESKPAQPSEMSAAKI